jgi:hypothetical protein
VCVSRLLLEPVLVEPSHRGRGGATQITQHEIGNRGLLRVHALRDVPIDALNFLIEPVLIGTVPVTGEATFRSVPSGSPHR